MPVFMPEKAFLVPGLKCKICNLCCLAYLIQHPSKKGFILRTKSTGVRKKAYDNISCWIF